MYKIFVKHSPVIVLCKFYLGSKLWISIGIVNSLHSPSSDVSPIFKYNLFIITMSLILFGLMTVLVDVFQRYDINKQAGEQYHWVFAKSTLCRAAITRLQHLLAPGMQEHHVKILPVGSTAIHSSFSSWCDIDALTIRIKKMNFLYFVGENLPSKATNETAMCVFWSLHIPTYLVSKCCTLKVY